ncbi:MAG: GNAT family N-acetyltransferase, partial [Bacteroidetes bacterium]
RGEVREVRDAGLMAAALFATYQDRTLYLMGAYHPDQGRSGAMPALMWDAMARAQREGSRLFDFEGSMIEGVAQFFRKFGAHPVPYLQIRKNQLPLLVRWMQELRT